MANDRAPKTGGGVGYGEVIQWYKTRLYPFVSKDVGASPKESFEVDNSRVTAIYDVDWESRKQAVLDILGASYAGGGGVVRNPPLPYYLAASATGDKWLFATKILECKPVGVDNPGAATTYKYARLTILFETLPYDVPGDVVAGDESSGNYYVVKRLRPSAEYLNLPTSFLNFTTGAEAGQTVPDASAGIIVPTFTLTLTWVQVPVGAISLPCINPDVTGLGNIGAALGKVNSAEFLGFPAETCLLMAADLTPRRLPNGQRAYDVQFQFKVTMAKRSGVEDYGHNLILGRQSGAYQRVARVADATKGIYETVNMSSIFRTT